MAKFVVGRQFPKSKILRYFKRLPGDAEAAWGWEASIEKAEQFDSYEKAAKVAFGFGKANVGVYLNEDTEENQSGADRS